jgi:hypothetical protein
MLTVTILCLVGCSKPKPNAPTQDFANRHRCPVTRVQSSKEGADRMRVTGCGESDYYVRSCENRGAVAPPPEQRQPLSEAEARIAPPNPPVGGQGCAWEREHKLPAPPAGSASQPWLSAP